MRPSRALPPAMASAKARSRSLLRAAAAAALLLSCGPLTETGNPVADGPATETGNPTLTGILHDTSGLRAGGAMVVLWRLPRGGGDTALLDAPSRADSQRTQADGSYRFDSLAAGTYALEGADGARGLFAWVPRAEIPADGKGFLRRDTLVLKRPGRLAGTARRDGNALPAGVRTPGEGIVVRVAGTGRAALTDSAGAYVLEDVPEGRYSVAFAAADGHYLPAVLGPLEVTSGGDSALPEVVLAWSPFADPPAPAGLTVAADTAAGTVRLRWRGVRVSNFHHYEVVRRDSLDTLLNAAFSTTDTVFTDTVRGLPAGRLLRYAVAAVNQLGARGPEGGLPAPVAVPRPPDTVPAAGTIAVLVLDGALPARVLVRLHAAPAGAGSLDSMLRQTVLVDSAWTGEDGRAAFTKLAAGAYTLECAGTGGAQGAASAAKVGVRPRGDGEADTLRLAAPGSIRGSATRRQIWCSTTAKLNENIQVSLAGTPWFAVTDTDGKYALPGIPAGAYRAVVQALPQGCFLPDTVEAVVQAGKETLLPEIPARTDPEFIPKVAGLRITGSAREGVSLEWYAVPSAFTSLGGYEVVRRDADLAILASSGLVAGTAWKDDLSSVPSGTRVNYVVRAVRKDGKPGPFGGDLAGNPVYFTVP